MFMSEMQICMCLDFLMSRFKNENIEKEKCLYLHFCKNIHTIHCSCQLKWALVPVKHQQLQGKITINQDVFYHNNTFAMMYDL